MKDIKETRKQINEIDKEMANLFERRMELAKDVAEYKKELGLPIEDKVREKEVIARNSDLIANSEIKDLYIDFINSNMNISKRYQRRLLEGMKVAYCGVEGAFAHIASKRLFATSKLIGYPSFMAAYNSVEQSECDVCVLPLENSFAGDVGLVMDLMFQGNLYVNDVIEIEVYHNLLVKKGTKLEDVKKVMSHQQALSQCRDFIEKHQFETVEYPNTALAAKALSESDDASIAVIASEEVADLYGLEILKSHINVSSTNTTRFAVFSKTMNKECASKMGSHFILMFTVANEAGSLASTLNIIGSHGFNMRTLRSRPMKELMWNYYFFVELDGNAFSSDGREMIAELSSFCDRLKVVGTYHSKAEK